MKWLCLLKINLIIRDIINLYWITEILISKIYHFLRIPTKKDLNFVFKDLEVLPTCAFTPNNWSICKNKLIKSFDYNSIF